MEMTAEYYYKILGLPPGASMKEIKAAYRSKAKKFHPDLNKNPEAHENFLRVNEAYTFLVNYKEGALTRHHRQTENWHEEWLRRERQKARTRAAKNARMHFEDFKKTSIYKTTSMLSNLLDYFGLMLGIFIIFASAFGMYVQGLYLEVEGKEVLNIRGIVLEVMATTAGVLFIAITVTNIRKRKISKKLRND